MKCLKQQEENGGKIVPKANTLMIELNLNHMDVRDYTVMQRGQKIYIAGLCSSKLASLDEPVLSATVTFSIREDLRIRINMCICSSLL